jgi:hypothetical protein
MERLVDTQVQLQDAYVGTDEPLHFRHNVKILVHDAATGDLLDTITTKNLIVTTGLQQLIDLAKGDSTATISYGAVGTSATAAAAGQTSLLAEVFRGAITASNRSGVIWTITMYLSSTQANGNTLTEFGEFTAAALGVMFARITHTAIVKTSSITVTYLHTVTASAS